MRFANADSVKLRINWNRCLYYIGLWSAEIRVQRFYFHKISFDMSSLPSHYITYRGNRQFDGFDMACTVDIDFFWGNDLTHWYNLDQRKDSVGSGRWERWKTSLRFSKCIISIPFTYRLQFTLLLHEEFLHTANMKSHGTFLCNHSVWSAPQVES